MNSITKYRAYDTVTKQMLYMGNVINTFLVGSGENWEAIERWKGYDCVDEKVIWMPFIEIQDKNYNDIYEGDIIRGDQHWCMENASPHFRYGIVRYLGYLEMPEFSAMDGKSIKLRERCISADDLSLLKYDLEIIGNIYEHPHLLEGSKNVD